MISEKNNDRYKDQKIAVVEKKCLGTSLYYCPVCNHYLASRYIIAEINYCHNCGQRVFARRIAL